MALMRRMATWASPAILWLVALAPIAALVPAAVLDVGTAQQVRVSLFPLALSLYDPFVWTCVWNSLEAALVVSGVSLAAGVALGQTIVRGRFWGRPVVAALALGLAVTPAALLALGLRGLFAGAGTASLSYTSWAWRWLAWIWAASVQGTAVVAAATSSALGRINPDWDDAARLSGGSRTRIWYSVTWPQLRPTLAGSLGLVFVITLADPGAPLVLGLRRTLGFQLVDSASRPDPFPRLAGIALLTLSLTLAWQALLLRCWGNDWRTNPGRGVRLAHRQGGDQSTWPRLLGLLLAATVCLVLACAPLAGLARLALGMDASPADRGAITGAGPGGRLSLLADGHASTLVGNSALLGFSVAVACLLMVWWLPRSATVPQGQRWRGRVALLCGSVSPVIVGVGVLALLRLVDLAAHALRSGPGPSPAAWLEGVSILLEPYGSPPFLLYLGVCLAHLPVRAATLPARRDPTSVARGIEQALLAGAAGKRARRMALKEGSARTAGRIVLWATLAATSVAPAILLAPTIDRGPVGPAIIRLASVPGASQAAAALALLAMAANWTAVALASAVRGPVIGSMLEPVELA
jgi:ABC-type Fe3+ transport system permease subunit